MESFTSLTSRTTSNEGAADWTIGIPTYNRLSFLKEAIKSAEEQTLKPNQIIITDNCSTDGTNRFEPSSDSINLKIIRQSRPIPPVKNFNTSLAACTTQYFSWLQDDDYLFSRFGENMLPVLDSNPDAVAIVSYALFGKDLDRAYSLETKIWGPPPFQMDFGTGTPLCIKRFCLVPWLTHYWPGFSPTAIYRTDALKAAIGLHPGGEEYAALLHERYLFAALNTMGSIIYVPSILGIIRQHSNNASREIERRAHAIDRFDAHIRLDTFLSRCAPSDLSMVEQDFRLKLSTFPVNELNAFCKSLRHRKSRISRKAREWAIEVLITKTVSRPKGKLDQYLIKAVETAELTLWYLCPPALSRFARLIHKRFMGLSACLSQSFRAARKLKD